jgi:uncharacterized membrane protein
MIAFLTGTNGSAASVLIFAMLIAAGLVIFFTVYRRFVREDGERIKEQSYEIARLKHLLKKTNDGKVPVVIDHEEG